MDSFLQTSRRIFILFRVFVPITVHFFNGYFREAAATSSKMNLVSLEKAAGGVVGKIDLI